MKFRYYYLSIIFIILIFLIIPFAGADGVPLQPADYAIESLYFIPFFFLITLGIEFIIFYKTLNRDIMEIFKSVALINLFTNPLAQIFVLLSTLIFPDYLWYCVLIIEILVIIIESIFFIKKIPFQSNLHPSKGSSIIGTLALVSIANFASFLIGLLPNINYYYRVMILAPTLIVLFFLIYAIMKFSILYLFLYKNIQIIKLFKSVIKINIVSFVSMVFFFQILIRTRINIINSITIFIILFTIESYYFISLIKKESDSFAVDNHTKIVLFIAILVENLITLPLIDTSFPPLSVFPFVRFMRLIANFNSYYFLPLIPIFYFLIVIVEFIIYFLFLRKKNIYTPDLLKNIAYINLLTSPLAIFLALLLLNYLFIMVFLMEIFIIYLELIFLFNKDNNTFDKRLLTTNSAKIKLIIIICIVNLASMLLGFIPLGVFEILS